jgi:HSP20 family protein
MLRRMTDPLTAMLAIQRALEARRESDWMGRGTAGTGAYPPINIFQQNDDFLVLIELPGVEKDELQIEAKENTIRVSGQKKPNYDENASVHRRERRFGVFDRTISLPVKVAAKDIRAEYRDGLLALFIPPLPSEKPRSIKIS